MSKSYYSLGLMSGTSMDGVDASVIQTDGNSKYKPILDKYFEYPEAIYKHLTKLRDKIKKLKDLKKYSKEIKNVEKEITLFHAKSVNQILKKTKANVNFIGFHGQTIYHNAKERISKQLGDGKLLSKITKKTVVYNFRQNDLKNGGVGAPLTPIFHKLLINQKKIKTPIMILNLGGIANWTVISKIKIGHLEDLHSADAGPGNYLIDQWMRKNSKQNYDKNGSTAKSGNINQTILNIGINNYEKFVNKEEKDNHLVSYARNRSYDVKDFNSSFVDGLSLKDGAATLTEYTSYVISQVINAYPEARRVIVCGGGRKNKFLLKKISEKLKYSLQPIDNFGINGDFVESQAFAYLAVRSYLKLPISFPETTGCLKECTGGEIIKF
jgi:anhydro-N-acetylmuramic acid kinase